MTLSNRTSVRLFPKQQVCHDVNGRWTPNRVLSRYQGENRRALRWALVFLSRRPLEANYIKGTIKIRFRPRSEPAVHIAAVVMALKAIAPSTGR